MYNGAMNFLGMSLGKRVLIFIGYILQSKTASQNIYICPSLLSTTTNNNQFIVLYTMTYNNVPMITM